MADDLDLGYTFREAKGGFDRVGEATFDAITPDQPVDDDLDVVGFVASQLRKITAEVDHLAVDECPRETLLAHVGQQRLVGALSTTHHWSQNLEPGAVFKREYPIDNLLRGLPHQRFTRFGIVWLADPSEQQTQVVVHLGDRADRRAGISTGRLLVDRDRR